MSGNAVSRFVQIVNNSSSQPSDNSAPKPTSASVAADGQTLTLSFDQELDSTAAQALTASKFSFFNQAGRDSNLNIDITTLAVGGANNNELSFKLTNASAAITKDQSILITYSDDDGDNAGSTLQDIAGNALPAIS